MTTRQPPAGTPARPSLGRGHLVHHVAIVVADLSRAEAFYAGVLGLDVLVRHTDDAGAPRAVWMRLSDPGAFLALEKASEAGPRRVDGAPGIHCLAFPIDRSSREIWRHHLASSGHGIERESAFSLYVRDPEGCLVALSHHPTPADL